MTHPDQPCAVCRRRPGDPRVCQPCTARMDTQLGELGDLWPRLPLAQLPAATGLGGDRVRTSKTAPLPLRLDALSLTAGGTGEARHTYVPAVRTWTSSIDVTVTTTGDDGQPVTDIRTVTTWHRELLRDERGRPVMVPAGDQAGVLPIATWLQVWEAEARRALGHAQPAGPESARLAPPAPDRLPQLGLGWLRDDHSRQVLHDYLGAVIAATQREINRVVLGLGTREERAAATERDPAAEEWALRYRSADRAASVRHRLRYLRTWLPTLSEQLPDVDVLAASLAHLLGACRAVLGDHDDRQYLGRCPEPWTDRGTGEEQVCGAELWHEPHVSLIRCPRCHAETSPDGYLWLGKRIRAVWPVDARRRYTEAERDETVAPPCADCTLPLAVEWREVTARRDDGRYFQPVRVGCSGCEQNGGRAA